MYGLNTLRNAGNRITTTFATVTTNHYIQHGDAGPAMPWLAFAMQMTLQGLGNSLIPVLKPRVAMRA
jgi:hypothetical protein